MFNLPLHPAIVHLPLGLAFILPLVALTLLIAVARGALPGRAWLLAALLQGAVLASALAAMRTGEGDEERVEARVSEALIETHEERAELFTQLSAVTLILLVAAGLSPKARGAIGGLATASTLVGAGLAVAVGHAGGALVHGPNGLTNPNAVVAGEATEAGGEGGWAGLLTGGAEEDEDEDDD